MAEFLGYTVNTPVTISSNQPNFTTDSLNLKRNSAVSTAQRFELQYRLGPNTDGNLQGTLQSHRMVNGFHTAFDVPIVQNPSQTVTGTNTHTVVTVAGALNANSVVITPTSFTSIPIGHYVTFSNHDKVYIVTSAFETVANTASTLNFFPRLRLAVPQTTTVNIHSVMMSCKYDLVDTIGYTYNNGIVTSVNLSFVEDV